MKKRILSLGMTLLLVGMLLLSAGCGKKVKETVKEVEPKEEKEMEKVYVAIEEGYFAEEGVDLTLVTGFGADKTMTAVISGEAQIGFMGSEASIYTYNEGAKDYVVNFAQLTQRAGNFLVAREEMPEFEWKDLEGKEVLGGRKGGIHISM